MTLSLYLFIYVWNFLSSSEYPSPGLKRPSSILLGEEGTPQMTHLPLECHQPHSGCQHHRVGSGCSILEQSRMKQGKALPDRHSQQTISVLDMEFLGGRGWIRALPAMPSAGSSLSSLHRFLLLSSPTVQPKPPMQL